MTSTMRAARVEELGKPLVIRDLEIPKPGAGQVLIKTEACGVCHTDLHAMKGDWPLKPQTPFTPGHEGIGIVTELGLGVKIVKEGDRVGLPWLYSSCGHCEYCLKARETVCDSAQFTGYTQDGGFAEYMLADPNYLAKIPASLKPIDAAPIVCAGVTTYKGVKETGTYIHIYIYITPVSLHLCYINNNHYQSNVLYCTRSESKSNIHIQSFEAYISHVL